MYVYVKWEFPCTLYPCHLSFVSSAPISFVSCNLTFQIIKCYLLCPKFLQIIFFLLNLYLGCTTNHRYITFGYLLHLMVESPFLFFMASSLLKKWMEQETSVRETPQRLRYRHSWRPFWMCLWHLPVYLMKLFSGVKSTEDCLFKCLTVMEIIKCQINGITVSIHEISIKTDSGNYQDLSLLSTTYKILSNSLLAS